MFKNYANAKDVLPEELFNRLKSEYTGYPEEVVILKLFTMVNNLSINIIFY